MPNNENISDIENRCTVLNHVAPRVRDSGIRQIFACGIGNSGKFCLWNPRSWNLEPVAWSPEFKTVLDFLAWEESWTR